MQRKRREVEREQDQRAKARRLLPQLIHAGALNLDQPLYFRREVVPAGAVPWSTKEPLYTAKLKASEGNKTLEWTDPESGETFLDSPSLQAARLLHRLGLRDGDVSSAGINGMHYWTVDGEISLKALGAEAGLLDGGTRHVDRDLLREICAAIPAGRWTTYGDLAAAIGVSGAAQSVAGVIATDHSIPNAHRVLRSTGRISPGWSASDGGGPEVARKRLDEEGLPFDGEVAEQARHWTPSVTPS